MASAIDRSLDVIGRCLFPTWFLAIGGRADCLGVGAFFGCPGFLLVERGRRGLEYFLRKLFFIVGKSWEYFFKNALYRRQVCWL